MNQRACTTSPARPNASANDTMPTCSADRERPGDGAPCRSGVPCDSPADLFVARLRGTLANLPSGVRGCASASEPWVVDMTLIPCILYEASRSATPPIGELEPVQARMPRSRPVMDHSFHLLLHIGHHPADWVARRVRPTHVPRRSSAWRPASDRPWPPPGPSPDCPEGCWGRADGGVSVRPA